MFVNFVLCPAVIISPENNFTGLAVQSAMHFVHGCMLLKND